LEQLKRLEGFNARRRTIAARFDRGFAGLHQSGELRLVRSDPRCQPAPFGYPVLCKSPQTRAKFRQYLEANGVETRPIICGNMVRQPAFKHLPHRVNGHLDGADQVMDCGIYWGPHPGTTDADVDTVIGIVKSFFDHGGR
jgi:CDP-6-deoxy-D-xylo-4-hexulose-3-dehydrase